MWERGDLSVLYGVFRNVANSRAVVTLFGGDWLRGRFPQICTAQKNVVKIK